jgi:hypothetical protein
MLAVGDLQTHLYKILYYLGSFATALLNNQLILKIPFQKSEYFLNISKDHSFSLTKSFSFRNT